MSCDVTKFTITRSQDNQFIFTIKADGSTLPMVLDNELDTFSADLIDLHTQDVVDTREVSIMDAANGKVSLIYNKTELYGDTPSLPLVSERGSKVDKYYLKPTYQLIIKCSTVSNGTFLAKVSEVYVD